MNETDKQILYETRPCDGFRYFAADTGNLPTMYTCGKGPKSPGKIVVVARNYEKDFALEEFDKAIAYYKMACVENGYDME